MLALQLNNLGLYTYANTVGQVPAGAMVAALNVVIDKPGVVETRRGFTPWGTALSGTINKLFAYKNRLLSHHGTTLSYDSDGNGTWVDYTGTFVAITGEKMRSVEVNQNLYFTTNNGLYKLDSLTGNPYQAGGVPALDTTAALTGSSGYLANGSQVAYRITWVYIDANGNTIEGNPSPAVIIANASGGTRNVNVTFTVPGTVTTAYYYRVYRTQSSTVTPGDTMFLAYSAQPTSGEISALSITVTDVTPDALLGLLLYTSPGAQGQFQTNDPPPLAKDICVFQGMTFYGNCQTIQQFYITLISVGSPNGIQVGDTISLVGTATRTYTGASSNTFASQQFKVDTSGTVAQNIDATARNIVSAVNQDPGNTEFYATYLTGYSQLPGQILIYARNLSHAIFYGQSSRGGAFSPVLPSSGTTYASSNNTVVNGIYVSKTDQPEAVPVQNLIFIGTGANSASFTVLRLKALRDAVIVYSKGGVFRITGNSPSSLTVQPYDTTVILYGNETADILNNSTYSFTTQGEMAVTESGSQIVSRNVEGDVLQLSAPAVFTNFGTLSFGLSYESDRKYILFLSDSTAATSISNLQYVYNWITQAFTTWNLQCTCAIINPFDNRMYFGGTDTFVWQERKTFTAGDYADKQVNCNILSFVGKTVVVDAVGSAQIGWTLGQGVTSGLGGISSVITGINGTTLTVTDTITWTVAAAAMYQPISASITYAPLTCGYPTYVKRFQPTMEFVFSQANFINATISFTTDMVFTSQSVSLAPKNTGAAWGVLPWGSFAWGTSAAPLQIIPTIVPKSCIVGHWLNITVSLNQAFQNLALDGITGFYDLIAERNR